MASGETWLAVAVIVVGLVAFMGYWWAYGPLAEPIYGPGVHSTFGIFISPGGPHGGCAVPPADTGTPREVLMDATAWRHHVEGDRLVVQLLSSATVAADDLSPDAVDAYLSANDPSVTWRPGRPIAAPGGGQVAELVATCGSGEGSALLIVVGPRQPGDDALLAAGTARLLKLDPTVMPQVRALIWSN